MTKLEEDHISASRISGIELKGGIKQVEEIKRKYQVNFKTEVVSNIEQYREKYQQFLKMHNNTSSKDVWKIYDHLTSDIC